MGTTEGYVTIYESSDGGTGDPAKTIWQFFVDPGNAARVAMTTTNVRLAGTMQLAVHSSSRVKVAYSDDDPHVLAQARIEFRYICEANRFNPCTPTGGAGEPISICEGKRSAPCNPREMPGGD